jgi:uncharacterized protein involved in exopolysaccharide biosynthesis
MKPLANSDPSSPETLAAQISQNRWLIVADTLDAEEYSPHLHLSRWIGFLVAVGENKGMLTLITFCMTGLFLAAALAMPNTYSASTALMPPQQNQSAAAALLGQFGELASFAGRDIVRNSSQLYISLLQSRTVADGIIAQFELMKIYGAHRLSDCRARLAKLTDISAGKDGVITIRVTDRDPKRAAAIANAYVSQLTKMNHQLAIGEAAQRRLFFEQQVQATRQQLTQAEDALARTEQSTGVIQLDAQARSLIEGEAALRARIGMAEAELQQMRTYAAKENPDLMQRQQLIAALRAEVEQLEKTSDAAPEPGNSSSGLVTAGVEYLRRLREVKYQQALFETLSKQLEAARLDEAKSAALIQVIDPAEVPDRKSGPKRMLIVAGGFLLGLTSGFLWILAKTILRQADSDPDLQTGLFRLRRSFALSLFSRSHADASHG